MPATGCARRCTRAGGGPGRPPIQWELILAAAIGGVVLGWVAGALTRRAAEEQFILNETAATDDPMARAEQDLPQT